jgi:hypothetical protein
MPALAKPASRTAKSAAAPKPKPAAAKPKAATAGASHPPYFEVALSTCVRFLLIDIGFRRNWW